MINISTAQKSSSTIEVVPSDSLFDELGKNSYDYKDLLSELIDNSIAARESTERLKIVITLDVDNNGNKLLFTYNDNAKGICREKLGDALSPGRIQTANSLNEHGLGMKQAIAALGKLKYLCTKTKDQQKACYVNRLGFGIIDIFEIDWDQPYGTEICVSSLKPIVDINQTNISRSIVHYLGARYRRFLKKDAPKMELVIRIFNTDTNSIQNEWYVTEEKPIYFSPSTRRNEPVFSNFELKGASWKARLTFGYAPSSDDDYQELGIEKPTKFTPYHVSIKNQGFDVIFHDRVILFHQLSELGIIEARHNHFNLIRGEIELISGFQTAITKNLMIHDEAFADLISQVRKILNGEQPGPNKQTKDYLKRISHTDEIPERLLRDRLADWLKTNPAIGPKKEVTIEYSVDGIEGFIDILADGEAWELKTGSISALEVYQLFMYMDVKGINKGYIVGKEITSGGNVAIEYIAKNHNKTICFSKITAYPIYQAPSRNEIDEYY